MSTAAAPTVTLWRPPTNRQPSHELEILQSHFQAIPFTGRESILAAADAWLATPSPISGDHNKTTIIQGSGNTVY